MALQATADSRGRARGVWVALATAVGVLVPVAVLGTAGTAGATAVAPDPGPIAEVAVGPSSACALSQSGTVACWGDNSYGQLGDGTTTDSNRPVPITTAGTPLAGKTVAHVYVGNGRACALTTDGVPACWGQNNFGQLGVGSYANSSLPKALTGALTGATVVDLAIGDGHSCAATSAGAAVCWGGNGNGQLGIGTFSTANTPTAVSATGTPMDGKQIVQVTAGNAHTCATSADGLAYCWGFGGKLGNGGAANDNQPKPVAVTTTGTPLDGKTVAEVRAGDYHTCARATDGTLACWGSGTSGQLGGGSFGVFTTANVPVAVSTSGNALTGKTATQLSAGASHTCVRTSAGTAACWGADSRSQLGDRGETATASAVGVDVSGTNIDASIAKVAAGGTSTCAITDGGELGCWGFNHTGQLGRGTEGQSKVPAALVSGFLAGKVVLEVDGGSSFACARTASGVACWGSNAYGQLGDGTTTNRTTPVPLSTAGTGLAGKTIVDLTVGSYHACALADDGTVACWGRGSSGQLGTGSSSDRTTPGTITTAGTALSGKTITTVEGGGNHTCAAASDGTVACWGSNSYGQLGDGTTTSRNVPTAVTRSGSPLAGQVTVQLAAGASHTCARTAAEGLACWGDGDFGLLGTGVVSGAPDALTPATVTTAGTPIAGKAIGTLVAGGYHNCVVTTDGIAACWGFNGYGQIGIGSSTNVAVPTAVSTSGALAGGPVGTIAASGDHTCATGGTTGVVCFGAQVTGSLGNGTNIAKSTSPVAVATAGTPLASTAVAELTQLYTGSCAITVNRDISCWGGNAEGQLGNGSPAFEPTAARPLWAAGSGTTAPGAPAITGAVAGNQQVSLTWSAPGSDGGSSITGYVITPYISGVAQSPVASPGSGTTKTVTGLTNGTTYTFKVAATNAVGTGAQSAASSAVTPAATATVPGMPTFKSYGRGDQSVTMSWNAPFSDGGSPITGYVITPYIGGTAQTPIDVAGTGTNYVVTGLTNGTSYTFRLAARNAIGVGASTVTPFAVTPAGVPVAPSIDSVVAGDAQATLTWTAVGGNGSTISGYVITPYKDNVAQTTITSTGTGTSKTVTGLINGASYTFTVSGKNGVGTGAASAKSSPVTPIGGPPAPVIASAVRGDQQVTLTWTAPANGGGSPITGYSITPSIAGVAQSPIASSGTGTSKVITGLTNGTAYTFQVAAVSALGTGAQSAASDAVTPAAVPGTPSIGAVTAGNGTANVSWSAPASSGGDPITAYVVTPSIAGVAQTPVVSSGTGTALAVTGLSNGTTYTFTVAARNSVGDSAPSTASAAVTPDVPAPFASWLLFVRRQHQDLTGALPSAGVENVEVNALATGLMSKGDLIESLRSSTDNLTNVDPTARLYRAFLGRTPDAGGLKFWLGRRRSGSWNLTRIADSFATSNEFKTKYGSLTNRQFVTRIYTDVLGRTADQAGVDYWTKKLDTKARTRGGVMVGFSESSEYKRKQADNTDAAVASIFLLGRAPTAAELAAWIARVQGGATRALLATELLDSAGYATHITG